MSIQALELYGLPVPEAADNDFAAALERAYCPFRRYHCDQVDHAASGERAEKPHGVCLVRDLGDGEEGQSVPVCPSRMLDGAVPIEEARRLLHRAGEGCALYLLPGVVIPGDGMVDYLLVSVRDGLPVDFVGLDIYPVHVRGSVWDCRDRALARLENDKRDGAEKGEEKVDAGPGPELDWHGTAKDLLQSLHLKLGFFERLGKRLVVAAPEALVTYMREEFAFDMLPRGHGRESLRLNAYRFGAPGDDEAFPPAFPDGNADGEEGDSPRTDDDVVAGRPRLTGRLLLNSMQVAMALGLQANVQDELSAVLSQLSGRLTPENRWRDDNAPPTPADGDA